MGAAYLCAHCRIDGELRHASYLQSWLKVLRSDKRAIFTAAAHAQRAADYLLQLAQPPERSRDGSVTRLRFPTKATAHPVAFFFSTSKGLP